jgi:hypothetical protein
VAESEPRVASVATRRRLVIAFVAWHLMAIVLGAIPPPNTLSNFPDRNTPGALGPTVDGLTRAIDRVTQAAFVVPRAFMWLTSPIHPLAAAYRRLTGVGQSWAMFSNPPPYDEYVRTRYYVQPPQGRTYIVSELVSPALREDRLRLVESYRASYQDKAIAIALASFYSRRKKELIAPETRSEQLPDDLAPIGRYFARRYAGRWLEGSGARIVRTEVWIGRAKSPDLGVPRDEASHTQRLAALQVYYDGPIEERLYVPDSPPYHAGENEADIQWLLEYYEEPK